MISYQVQPKSSFSDPECPRFTGPLIDRALCAALWLCRAHAAHAVTPGPCGWRFHARLRDGTAAPADFNLQTLVLHVVDELRCVTDSSFGSPPDPHTPSKDRSICGVPVYLNGRVVAALMVFRDPGTTPFDSGDLRALQALSFGFSAGYRPGSSECPDDPPRWPSQETQSPTGPAVNLDTEPKAGEFLPGYVYAGAVMGLIRARCRELARRDCAVLILGPTGSGKAGVAKFIHAESRRAGRPMIREDLSTIPESLLEARLRGHEEGAFTDAKGACPGLFESADETTLFLDEIQNLSLGLQKILLGYLDREPVRRLGGATEVKSDFRLIVASNEDLFALVKAGKFRADLYYRLRVGLVQLLPLADRPEDIVPIARAYLLSKQPRLHLDACAETWLLAQPWAGNVREMFNLLEACAGTPESWITARMLAEQAAMDGGVEAPVEYPGLDARVEEFKKSEIARALARSGGKAKEAAKILGVPARRLREMRRKQRPSEESGEKSPPRD